MKITKKTSDAKILRKIVPKENNMINIKIRIKAISKIKFVICIKQEPRFFTSLDKISIISADLNLIEFW